MPVSSRTALEELGAALAEGVAGAPGVAASGLVPAGTDADRPGAAGHEGPDRHRSEHHRCPHRGVSRRTLRGSFPRSKPL